MNTVSFVHPATRAHDDSSVCLECGALSETKETVESDYHNPLSLDKLMVRHPSATYFLQVGTADAVVTENTYLGVRTGDILIIDRSLTPTIGALVLTTTEGELTLCRYTEHDHKRYLVCGERGKEPRELSPTDETSVWGVVSALSRRLQ